MHPVDFVLLPTVAAEYMAMTALMNTMCLRIVTGWFWPWEVVW